MAFVAYFDYFTELCFTNSSSMFGRLSLLDMLHIIL